MIINIVRKPLVNNVCENITLHNTGGINIDQTRIQFETDGKRKETKRTPREESGVWTDSNSGMKKEKSLYADADPKGRFPANVVISTEVSFILDSQSGISTSTGGRIGNAEGAYGKLGASGFTTEYHKGDGGFGDTSGASRYFKVVKEDE